MFRSIPAQNVPGVRVMFCDLSFRQAALCAPPGGLGVPYALASTGQIMTLQRPDNCYHRTALAESAFIEPFPDQTRTVARGPAGVPARSLAIAHRPRSVMNRYVWLNPSMGAAS